VVVIARDEKHVTPVEGPAERLEERAGGGEGTADGLAAELDGVAEENEPIDAVEGLEQGPGGDGPAEDVGAQVRADVEVGDDQGAQRLSERDPGGSSSAA
jgi:hypothetical protein